ncbi:hypothetical protein DM02DRAFT_732435 [Periconia macrospinosa]|uniref:Uncharacterized protein n=1 Tax=Periconia macrospinosa TaxID=97972 RepID=A0A2V1DBJ7_9PLEO|nr:hypothetical protein DM02DRAFT_732435 [Periconia macrospinosa]
MKGFYTIFLTSLLGQGILAKTAAPKLNQYRSIDDCKADKNIISHASPSLGSTRDVDASTVAVYLVAGSAHAGQHYYPRGANLPKSTQDSPLAMGECIYLPGGTRQIYKDL